MSRKAAPGSLIHCEYCGEDYSATYKRCPFCGEKPSPGTEPIPPVPREALDDDYVFEGQDLFDTPEENVEEERPSRGSGGRRLGGQDEKVAPINWPRLITFICSLVMIAAALIIVFAYIYPKVSTGSNPPATDPPPPVSEPASQPPVVNPTEPVDPTEPTEPDPTEPTAPVDTPPTETTGKITGVSTGVRVRSLPDTESEKVGSLKNGAAVTVLSDAGDGWYQISFSSGGQTVTGYIKSEFVKLDNPLPSTQPVQTGEPLSGGLKAGPAKVAHASNGLNVRSGPGTSHEKIGSLHNGDAINLIADGGDGWIQITYTGSGGKLITGYIKGEYVSQS